ERLKPRAREMFAEAVTRKLGWYGADLLAVREVARDEAAVLAAYEEARRLESELVLFAGASSIDPMDAAYAQLEAAGGELLRLGGRDDMEGGPLGGPWCHPGTSGLPGAALPLEFGTFASERPKVSRGGRSSASGRPNGGPCRRTSAGGYPYRRRQTGHDDAKT